jgi:hypothetical protein
VRLSDPGRVAELAAELPQLRIALDSGQYIPPPDARAERLRHRSSLEVLVKDPRFALGIDTLAQPASQAEMAARCWELRTALLDCGLGDDTVARLLHDVNREAKALSRFPSSSTKDCVWAPCGCPLGMTIGTVVGWAIAPPTVNLAVGGGEDSFGGVGYGCAAGGLLGVIAAEAGGSAWRARILARHSREINELVHRFNRIFVVRP